jgi:hypothetical protein
MKFVIASSPEVEAGLEDLQLQGDERPRFPAHGKRIGRYLLKSNSK